VKKSDFLPILVVPAIPFENGIRFLHQSRQLDINGEITDCLWKILAHCNGYTDISKITVLSGLDESFVDAVIDDLIAMDVVVDSREQYLHFHRISNNPSSYFRHLSNDEVDNYTNSKRAYVKEGETLMYHKNDTLSLFDLQVARKSCRNFSNEKMTRDQVGNICSYGYSISRHAVPSAGCLYPLKLYVIVAKDQEGLPAGYYEYDAENDILILYNKDVDVEQLKYCFNSEILPFNSPVQIVIAADIHRQPYKYSNRGYRFTMIEVGAVAQNISLACIELSLASCELGGMIDISMARELGLDDGILPILGLAVGKISLTPRKEEPSLLEVTEELFVGKDKPILECGLSSIGDKGSFFGAFAHYDGDEISSTSGATATSIDMAKAKAILEGYERYVSKNVRWNFRGSKNDLEEKKIIDPNKYYPLTKNQVEKFKLQSFTDSLELEWIVGSNAFGEEVFVPIDYVFYPIQNIGRKLIAKTNSSGVAVFDSFKEAERRGLLEVIERDAIMQVWFEQKPPNKLLAEILPLHERKRLMFWKSQNRDVHVFDISKHGIVVTLVVITGTETPYFVCGAASSNVSFEDSVRKAYREAEFALLCFLRNPLEKRMNYDDVFYVSDHSDLCKCKGYAEEISWLWKCNPIISYIPTITSSLDNLKVDLETVTIKLTDNESKFVAVKVLSEKLIPISFGFGEECYSHPQIEHLNFSNRSLALPHFFA
jgi:thiazole/oxazole-forming peptide maturase SagD family component